MNECGIDLLQKLIALDPRKRISMKEAIKHPYFADINISEREKYNRQ